MNEVTVSNVDIKFGTLIWLMVKVTFALIPAAIVIGIIWAMFGALFLGMFAVLKGAL